MSEKTQKDKLPENCQTCDSFDSKTIIGAFCVELLKARVKATEEQMRVLDLVQKLDEILRFNLQLTAYREGKHTISFTATEDELNKTLIWLEDQ